MLEHLYLCCAAFATAFIRCVFLFCADLPFNFRFGGEESFRRVFKLPLYRTLLPTGMEKLRELDLSGNRLSRLEAHQFPLLLHMQILKLDNCKISFIHNYAFVNLPNITSLQ